MPSSAADCAIAPDGQTVAMPCTALRCRSMRPLIATVGDPGLRYARQRRDRPRRLGLRDRHPSRGRGAPRRAVDPHRAPAQRVRVESLLEPRLPPDARSDLSRARGGGAAGAYRGARLSQAELASTVRWASVRMREREAGLHYIWPLSIAVIRADLRFFMVAVTVSRSSRLTRLTIGKRSVSSLKTCALTRVTSLAK